MTRWAQLAGSGPIAATLGRDLISRWSQPHRHYHDVTHLTAVLDAIDLLLADGAQTVEPSAVRFAAWFHDAVYDGVPGDDERASAELVRAALPALNLRSPSADEVARLVLVTVNHDPAADDVDGALLCDADLAVLGADPNDYAEYVRRVRLDYAHVEEATFRSRRAAVVRRLLDADPLFHTAAGRHRWDARARSNLRAELDQQSRSG